MTATPCAACGSSDTAHGAMTLERRYKNDTICVDVTATCCTLCHEVVMDAENSAIYSEALNRQRLRVDGQVHAAAAGGPSPAVN
ncbi:YgiT-type zinc finger protein [Comamonas thiooxydans]|uniref:YgiT-type zinc finger protein n=1 Tax=Comamonas thiooxydans TaxID=363952 RepID=UPI000B4161B9|nr:YgiT-type zinc finger protein [Comamonas thiooxydans]